MTIRISLGAILAGLLLVAIGAGGAVGVMLWEPWDGNGATTTTEPDDDTDRQASEQPTVEPSPQRLLTPTEAEAVALRFISDERTLAASEFECQANDYNEPRGEWIVKCSATVTIYDLVYGTEPTENTIRRTIAVNDQTSEARQLSP